MLVDVKRNVSDLIQEVWLSQTALSRHLARLRQQGLVETRRQGQNVFYQILDGLALEAKETESAAQLERVQKIYRKVLSSQAEPDASVSRNDAAVARVTAARASMKRATKHFAYTRMVAPDNCIVVERYVDPDETVNIGNP